MSRSGRSKVTRATPVRGRRTLSVSIKDLRRGLTPSGVRGIDVLIRERCTECDWPVVALRIGSDHVHLFVEAHPEHSPS
nr:transposase [Frankia gtarii]